MANQLLHGDCLEVLKTLPSSSVDAIVTDPPAGIFFMAGKNKHEHWDSDKGGSQAWIGWMESVARECLRVLKPGGHALVWAIPRTSHWTGMAWETRGGNRGTKSIIASVQDSLSRWTSPKPSTKWRGLKERKDKDYGREVAANLAS